MYNSLSFANVEQAKANKNSVKNKQLAGKWPTVVTLKLQPYPSDVFATIMKNHSSDEINQKAWALLDCCWTGKKGQKPKNNNNGKLRK